MITGITELKTLTKHLSRECKRKFDVKKFDVIQIKSGITINVDVSVRI